MHFIYLLGVFFLHLLVPGPSTIQIVRGSVSGGKRHGARVALGLVGSDLLYATIAMIGVGNAIRSLGLTRGVAVAGGLIIALLGVRMAYHSRPVSGYHGWGEQAEQAVVRPFFTGLSTGLANPQAIVFFVSLAMAVASYWRSMAAVPLALLAIGVVSLATRLSVATIFSLPAIRAGYLRHRHELELVFAACLALFGAGMLVDNLLR